MQEIARQPSRMRMLKTVFCLSFFVSFVSFVVSPAFGAGAWSTYRGNSERTGNTDGLAGPKNPAVLWAFKHPESYLASPVPLGKQVFISGLGGFNVSTFYSLAIDPKAPKRDLWSKSTPFL